MEDILDMIRCILIGVVIGMIISSFVYVICAKAGDSRDVKFCPVCGEYYQEDDMYCIHDGEVLIERGTI